MPAKICRVCGEREQAHHEYEPTMPDGCQCDPGSWDDDVTEVCAAYVGDPGKGCDRCEHDERCHGSHEDEAT